MIRVWLGIASLAPILARALRDCSRWTQWSGVIVRTAADSFWIARQRAASHGSVVDAIRTRDRGTAAMCTHSICAPGRCLLVPWTCFPGAAETAHSPPAIHAAADSGLPAPP
ncbi:hypothetical protein K438DRAFT_886673 [Mycena galopus ATCC 62051]|nr:hypothetical protein K438DRAFT_886673 [Mycena galopus ATCC 62051]